LDAAGGRRKPVPDAKLVPPPTKGHVSIARVSHAWYVVCEARELGKKPLRVELLGTPLVLFRAEGGSPAALLDRCPHRNAPKAMIFFPSATLKMVPGPRPLRQ